MANKPRVKAPAKAAPATRGPSRNALIAIVVVVVAAIALIGGSLALTGGGDEEAEPTTPIGTGSVLSGLPQSGTILGNPDAKVTLIEYADLQCPFCRQYAEEGFPGIVDNYIRPTSMLGTTGDLKLEFRGLAFLGDDSEKALRFVHAAGLQDKGWDMTEALYANQGGENSGWVTDELVRSIGEQIEGLDVDKMFADTDAPEVDALIKEADQQSSTVGIKGTPAFFIKIGDDPPYAIQPTSLTTDGFRAAIDDALGR